MKDWSEEDFINYLMTSDFDENHSPEELKFLLLKFRQFYRIKFSVNRSIDLEKKAYQSEIEQLKLDKQNQFNELTHRINHVVEVYNLLTTRKLTFMERLLGKLKPKPNEII